MKKLLIFAVLCMFMLGGMTYATDTRVMTMGDANNIVKDDANIWLYPSTINYFPKLFIGEYESYGGEGSGMDDLWRVGANLLFGEDSEKPMVLGAYFSTDRYGHYILDMEDEVDQRISLFYGREIKEIPFGFYLGFWSEGDKNEDTDVTDNQEQGLKRLEFGFGLSPMQKKLDLSFKLAMTTWTDEDYNWWGSDSGYVSESEASGNMDIDFMARYWMAPIGNYTLIPHGALMMEKQGVDWYGYDGSGWVVLGTDEYKTMELNLGLGMNYDAGSDVLVVGDFGFAIRNVEWTTDYTDPDTDDYEYTRKYLVLPYFKLGIDANVFKWMDFRCGVTKSWETRTDEPGPDMKQTYWYADTDTYLGAGFMWGNFTIDAWIAHDFLENGPYFVSGASHDLNERVTLKYAF